MRTKKDVSKTQELTKTRQILWRFSRVEKDIDKKRTTFSELFFDLAVVFIFSLLSSRLMGSIGHAVVQDEDSVRASLGVMTHLIDTNNHFIGVWFWMAHFMALWYTWYQFSNYTKYHWIDNIGNNVLTLFLIFTLVIQGAGIYFDNAILANYSLLISFISARVIFASTQFVAVHYSHKTDISRELMIKVKRQMLITTSTIIFTLVFVLINELGYLPIDVVHTHHPTLAKVAIPIDYEIFDPWRVEAFVSAIITTHLVIRFIWKVSGAKNISDSSYKIVFHTKERHHLFIIIALGEILVVTLTSSFINDQTPALCLNTVLYLFITPLFAIVVWYIYKTVFYKSSPTKSKRNYYLYTISHVFLVLGILIFLGSIKSHMKAEALIASKAFASDLVRTTARTYYSLGIVVGMFLITAPMASYAVFAKLDSPKWGKLVKGISGLLVFKAIVVGGWLIAETTLFWLGIEVRFSTVMFSLLAIKLVFSALLIWQSQRSIKASFGTVEEYDNYLDKLDK